MAQIDIMFGRDDSGQGIVGFVSPMVVRASMDMPVIGLLRMLKAKFQAEWDQVHLEIVAPSDNGRGGLLLPESARSCENCGGKQLRDVSGAPTKCAL